MTSEFFRGSVNLSVNPSVNPAAIELTELYAPGAIVFCALLLGLLFEILALRKLREVSAKSRLRGQSVIVGSVRGVTTLWFVVGGVYVALSRLSLDENLRSLLDGVLLVSLIVSGAIVLSRVSAGLIRAYTTRVQGLPSSSLLPNFARVAIFLVAALVIMQSAGVKIAPLVGALGIGGLAIALALQETLSNLFSGIVIMASKQLRPGDFVKLDTGEEGYVQDVTWRNTTIRALSNNMVIVPNAKLAQSTLTNYYQPERQMSVIVPVRVGYASDLEHVEEVTISVANDVMSEIEGGVPEFEPLVRFNNFGEFGIDFSAIMSTREVTEQYRIQHEFTKRLHRRYHEEGIEIPQFPTSLPSVHAGSQ